MTNRQKKSKPAGRDPETGRIYFDSVDDIPEFSSDEEELEWLDTHTPSVKFFKGARHVTLKEMLATKGLRQ